MGRRSVCLVALVMLLCSQVFASPVNMPTAISSKEGAFLDKEGKDVDASASFVFDNISERKMKDYSAEASANIYAGRVALSLMDKFDIYALFGGISGTEYKGVVEGSDVTLSCKDNFLWGIGLNAIVYEWEKEGIKLFADGNYREAQDIDLDTVTIDGTEYQKPDVIDTSAKWQEWQVAFGVSKEFQYFIPYAGIKYSDVKAGAKATYSGTVYNAGNTKSKDKVGPFVGVSLVPTKGVSIDLQGRFVDETAFSVIATLKF